MLVKKVLSLALLFASMIPQAFALEASGLLQVRNSRRILTTTEGVRYTLRGADRDSDSQLRKLGSGDYVVVVGEPRGKNELLISEIQFVGLKQLLGYWADESNALVNIVDFRELRIYRPVRGSSKLKAETVIYNLAPDSGPGWLLLMLHEDRAIAGRISLVGDRVSVELPPSHDSPLISNLKRLR